MPKDPKSKVFDGARDRQPSIWLAMIIITLIGAGAGAGFAFAFLTEDRVAAPKVKSSSPEQDSTSGASYAGRFPPDAVEIALDPIITGLGAGGARKIRLEASVIMTKEATASATLKTELTEDIVVFLNTVTAEEISGARGLQNLREDLDDRVRIRGRGTVLGLLISGFVIE